MRISICFRRVCPGRRDLGSIAVLATIVLLACAGAANAAAPVKLVLSSHLGWEVDQTTKANVCTTASKDICQAGKASAKPEGYEYPEGVAGLADGDIYVADNNQRIQELTPAGEFIAMFGKEVNASTHGDTCSEEEIKSSGVKCQQGQEGASSGAFASPTSIAVAPGGKSLYIEDYANWRVDEYTPAGQLMLMIGKEVNRTQDEVPGASEAAKNLCTVASKDTCQAGRPVSVDSSEQGAFNFHEFVGDLLAVGGPAEELYVGDAHRVQIFDEEGKSTGEIKLSASMTAARPNGQITSIAVDKNTVYVVYEHGSVVSKFNASDGEPAGSIEARPREENGSVEISAIAINGDGRLAVTVNEAVGNLGSQFGELYNAATGKTETSFTIEGAANFEGVSAISFDAGGDLDMAVSDRHEIRRYVPEPVGEVLPSTAACIPGEEKAASASFACTLHGEANPYAVPDTKIWFEWGNTCTFGNSTPLQAVEPPGEAFVPVDTVLRGLRPHAGYCYRLAAVDENVQLPEELTSEHVSLTTPPVAPRILGAPSASFVTSSSAVLFGEANPENTSTSIAFQYAKACANPETACPAIAQTPGVQETTSQQSAVYGPIGANFEAEGLQPATTYRYQMVASNETGQAAVNETGGSTLPQGTFTTAPAPVPQATSSAPSAVTATSATIAGSVDPDGQPATYAFELGVYAGAQTRYGIVLSASAAGSNTPTEESLGLTGLQPGTTYAYRIEIASGYGIAYGEPVTFTTAGQPSILMIPVALARLAVPTIVFPPQVKPVAVKKASKKPNKKSKPKNKQARKKAKKSSASGNLKRSH